MAKEKGNGYGTLPREFVLVRWFGCNFQNQYQHRCCNLQDHYKILYQYVVRTCARACSVQLIVLGAKAVQAQNQKDFHSSCKSGLKLTVPVSMILLFSAKKGLLMLLITFVF